MHSVTWNDDLLARVVLDPVLLSDLFCCEDRLGCKVLSIVRGCSLCCWRAAVIATQPASIWISLFCWQAAKRPWVLYVTSATNQAGIANERLSTRLNCVACILTLFKQRFLRYRVKRVAGQESCAQFMHREFIERVQRTTVNVLTLRKRRNAPRSCYYIYRCTAAIVLMQRTFLWHHFRKSFNNLRQCKVWCVCDSVTYTLRQ